MTVTLDSVKTNASRSRHHRKAASRPLLILHILCLLFSLTSLLLFSVSVPLWNANFFHNSGPIASDWSDMLPLVPLSITVLFSLFSLVTLFLMPKFRDAKAHHLPHLSGKTSFLLTTSVLLTLAPLLVVAGLTSVFRFWRAAVPSQSHSTNGTSPSQPVIICNMLNIFARECEPTLYRIGELQIGGIVTGSLSWMSVFGLWILSCRAWQADRRREARRRRKAAKNIYDDDEKTSQSYHSYDAGSDKGKHRSERRGHRHHHKSSSSGRNHRHHHRHHHEAIETQPRSQTTSNASQVESANMRSVQSHNHAQFQHKSPFEAHDHLFRSLSRSSRSKHYIPNLPFSRGGRGCRRTHHDQWHHTTTTDTASLNYSEHLEQRGRSPNGSAIEEVRRKLKPKETINVWLSHRHI